MKTNKTYKLPVDLSETSEQEMITKAIKRIQQMELYFDILTKTAEVNPEALWEDDLIGEMLQRLSSYYEDGQWLNDYELDEKGYFPQCLKRGVLAQDSVYNFLTEYHKKNI